MQHQFDNTMALIDEIRFDTPFSFVYSARPGTTAAGWVDDVPEATKKTWLQTFQARVRAQAEPFPKAWWVVNNACW